MSGREPVFTDPEFRGRFLEHVAQTGKSISGACRHFGVHPSGFHQYCKRHDPDFRLAYEDARAESADRVLLTMRELAESGDTSAANIYLKHVAPPPKQQIEVQQHHMHELTVDPATIRTIQELQAKIEQRALPEAYIDVESEEL